MTETIPAEVIEKMAEAATFPSEPYPVSDEQIKLALKAAEAAGYVLVSVEATEAMNDAAREWSRTKYGKPIGSDASNGCYDCMIAARPKVP